MMSPEYRRNRSQFPKAELAKHQGAWVAFSADGRRIVASALTIAQLEDRVAALREDPQRIVLEWIAGPEDETLLGGGELL